MSDLGQGFIDVVPRTDSFTAELRAKVTEALSQSEGAATAGASKLMAGVNAGLLSLGVATVAGIAKGISATQEWASQVRSLQKVTGLAAEDASKLTAAAEQMGIPVTKLSSAFGILSNNVVNGSTKLDQYGVATTDATGAALPFTDILGALSDKFQTLPAGIEQTAFAQAAFGKSGKDLIPILAKGSAGLQEQYDLAVKLGLVMSQDDLNAARDLTVAQRELSEAFKGASMRLAHDFLPVLTSVVNIVTDAVALFQKIPQPIITTTAAILGLTAGMRILQGIWGFVQSQVTALGEGFVTTAAQTEVSTEATADNTLATRDNTAAQFENATASEASSLATAEGVASTNAATASVDAELIAIHARNVALGEGIPIMSLASAGTGIMAKAATVLNSNMVSLAAGVFAFAKGLQFAKGEIDAFRAKDPVEFANNFAKGWNLVSVAMGGVRLPEDFAKISPQVDAVQKGLDDITGALDSGRITTDQAAVALQTLADKYGFELPQGAQAAAAALNITTDSVVDEVEAEEKAARATLAHGTSLGELARSAQPVSRLLDDMGMSTRSFASEARKAFVAGTFDQWSADFKEKVISVWQEFHDTAFGALNFVQQTVGELGTNLKEGAHLTAEGILRQFDAAKDKTESFGRDLLEISHRGGEAAKSLASSLLESGNVLAAQVIADAPGQLQKQIVRSFGAGETAADNFATKLTNSIKGPLLDIKGLLEDLLKGWNIPITADTKQAKYTIDSFIAAEGQRVITIGVQARNQFASGGVVPGFAAGGSTDTIPAMLSPGEFVMRRRAVDQIGVPTLQAMNAGGQPVTGPAWVQQKPQKLNGAKMRIYDWRNGLATLDAELGWEDAVRTR